MFQKLTKYNQYNMKNEEKLIRNIILNDYLVAKIPVGVYVYLKEYNGNSRFEYVSPLICQIFNLTESEILNDPQILSKAIVPEDFPSFEIANENSLENLSQYYWTGRFLINNEIKWINISSTPELKPNGDVLWHGLMNDITNQKLSKKAKNETNEKFKTIIETSPDGIAISSVEGIIEFVTYNTVKMWGYDSEDEIIGKSIFGFIHDSSHDKAKYFIKEMLNGNLTGTA